MEITSFRLIERERLATAQEWGGGTEARRLTRFRQRHEDVLVQGREEEVVSWAAAVVAD